MCQRIECMKVVIMAGGKGTRISSVASDIPKPMIKVEGIPVLEREIECLKDQGFDDIIMTVSHLGNIIIDYFGDGSGNSPTTGKPFGVHIEYYFEKEPLGNAGALFKIKDKLTSDFLLLNADAMFDVDFNRFVAFHQKHGGLVTLFTHPNSHPYDSGLIIANKNGSVEKWLAKEDERPQYYRNRVNAGLHVINPKVLELVGINADSVGKVDANGKPVTEMGKQALLNTYINNVTMPETIAAIACIVAVVAFVYMTIARGSDVWDNLWTDFALPTSLFEYWKKVVDDQNVHGYGLGSLNGFVYPVFYFLKNIFKIPIPEYVEAIHTIANDTESFVWASNTVTANAYVSIYWYFYMDFRYIGILAGMLLVGYFSERTYRDTLYYKGAKNFSIYCFFLHMVIFSIVRMPFTIVSSALGFLFVAFILYKKKI